MIGPTLCFCQALDKDPPTVVSLDPIHQAIDINVSNGDLFVQFNLSSNDIYIKTGNTTDIRIISLQGEILLEKTIESEQKISIDFLQSKPYLIQVIDKNGDWKSIGKFIKK